MFLEVNDEIINIDNVVRIKKTQYGKEWRILFLGENSEIFNLPYTTEAEMVKTYNKLKIYLVSKRPMKGLRDL